MGTTMRWIARAIIAMLALSIGFGSVGIAFADEGRRLGFGDDWTPATHSGARLGFGDSYTPPRLGFGDDWTPPRSSPEPIGGTTDIGPAQASKPAHKVAVVLLSIMAATIVGGVLAVVLIAHRRGARRVATPA